MAQAHTTTGARANGDASTDGRANGDLAPYVHVIACFNSHRNSEAVANAYCDGNGHSSRELEAVSNRNTRPPAGCGYH